MLIQPAYYPLTWGAGKKVLTRFSGGVGWVMKTMKTAAKQVVRPTHAEPARVALLPGA